MQLEVHPQHANGGGRKGDEDLIHAEVGHRADGLHHDAGQAHPVDFTDELALGPEAPELHLDKAVVLMQVIHAHQHAQQLAQHRGDGGACHPQLWEAQQAEDEDGVKDDVENGAGKLGKHGVEGIPGRLQDLFKHALENEENTGHPYIIEVGAGIVIDLRIRVEHGDQLGRKQGEQQPKGRAAEQGQEFSMGSGLVGVLLAFFPQATGHQGIDAHAGAYGHRHDQHLIGEYQGYGGEGVFADTGYENAVHDIIHSLHQHGHHHGKGHLQYQGTDGFYAHFILYGLLFFHVRMFPFRIL